MISFSFSGGPLRCQFFESPHTGGTKWLHERLEEHPIIMDSASLAEQILALGHQHAMLDNRHHAVEGEHNELLRHVTSLEKGLATAEKKRDDAVASLEESQKHEEDLRASTAEREKLFVEQLFSTTKALSDAAGISFDAHALRRADALAAPWL